MNKVYVGLDLGSSSFQQAAINQDGVTIMNRSYPTSEANLRIAFTGLRGEIHVHLEAGELAPWAAAVIAPLVKRVVLGRVESPDVRTAIKQLYEVLDQSVAAQEQARLLMLRAAQAFPEIKLLRTVPGVGPIGACRFSAYIHTPQRFSSKRKLWKYCRLSVSHRSSNGKPLRRPKLDYSGCGRLKDVSRKAFEVALRSRTDNGFKRTYQRALETTHDKTHARLTVQRKILSTLRAIWLTRTPYREELSR